MHRMLARFFCVSRNTQNIGHKIYIFNDKQLTKLVLNFFNQKKIKKLKFLIMKKKQKKNNLEQEKR